MIKSLVLLQLALKWYLLAFIVCLFVRNDRFSFQGLFFACFLPFCKSFVCQIVNRIQCNYFFAISYVVHCCVPDCHRRWTCLTESHKKMNYFLSILLELLSYLNIIKHRASFVNQIWETKFG